jgi:hypothetical protein
MEWQCVELVNRLYLTKGWISGTWSGDGDQLFGSAPSVGLTNEQKQGSISYLAPGDVISFTGPISGGHAAVVSEVSGAAITLVNQNTAAADTLSTGTLRNGSLVMNGWKGYTPIGVIHAPTPAVSAPVLSTYSADQTAAGDQTNDIVLTWTPSSAASGTVTGYSVLRNGTVIATVPATTTMYTDVHLPDGGMLTYQVSAADSGGNSSPLSNPVSLPYLPPGQSGLAWLGSPGSSKISYCRRGGTGGSFSTQYLICTVFNGTSWQTSTSPAGIDWGYDTGWAWLATKLGVAYCRRGGTGGSFSTQYLICSVFNGKTWKTTNSPAGIDWGYDT